MRPILFLLHDRLARSDLQTLSVETKEGAVNPKYCPKHKYIEPKCLACMTRYASALGAKNVLLEAVAEAARMFLPPKMPAAALPLPRHLTPNKHLQKVIDAYAALDREPGERGGTCPPHSPNRYTGICCWCNEQLPYGGDHGKR